VKRIKAGYLYMHRDGIKTLTKHGFKREGGGTGLREDKRGKLA
jgi:hypothetical protein